MGKHSEWRKLAKKARRKRIRQSKAKLRDQVEEEELQRRKQSPNYQRWLAEQAKVEEFKEQEEARLTAERELEWRRVEKEAQIQWQELQKKLAVAREERARQNEIIKQEWEKEQQRQKELKEQNERELAEKVKQQELLNERINNFLTDGGDTPEELKTKSQTNPGKMLCPFFQKTSSCRFFDACSRNHVRPGISRIILIPNFFTHYSLETVENEHGSDACLEFETYETYDHYREFFYDVIPELETFGKIMLFKACCNHEPHLRGNVYVEFSTSSAALKCYRGLNGRWYGGKQLNVEFCRIDSWKNALCGLFFVNRCPKGNACNFLHVFRNPRDIYNYYDDTNHKNLEHQDRNSDNASDRRNWRWSETPERLPSVDWEDRILEKNLNSRRKHRSRSKSKDSSERSKKSSHSERKKHSNSHSSSTKRRRSRSKSSSRRSRRSHRSRS